MSKHLRLLSFILIVSILFSLSTGISLADTKPAKTPAPATTYSDPELARAVSLGIGTYAKNGSITYKQFFQMLDVSVKLSKPSALVQWKKQLPKARASTETMRREEGMLAVYYAAVALGADYCDTNTDWGKLHDLIGEKWSDFSFNYPLFPDWNKPAKLGADKWGNHVVAAYFYSMGRISLYSETTIFDFDAVKVSMNPEKTFTYEDGLRAALRLYDSKPQESEIAKNAAEAAFLKKADERRKAILNSKTNVTIKGTSYYVSNSGNDNNDGRSPSTAWATLEKVNNADLKAGDGVLFQRGGLWRGLLKCKDNITYSAYGEGNKPKIYGSPENGASPDKWKLLEGTKNIWVFYKDMYDTGGIVFDDGKGWAARREAYWDGSKYVDMVTRKPIDIKKLENLTLFSAVDYTGYSSEEARFELLKQGKLYLRCDAGNPGSIYISIEFLCLKDNGGSEFVIQGADGNIIDNLCVMYSNGTGIQLCRNSTAQNCEVGWIGGAVMNFASFGQGILRVGDGITLGRGEGDRGINNSVINNYIHHQYDQAIAIEIGPGGDESLRLVENATVKGNLVERCSGGIVVADWDAAHSDTYDKPLFNNILIEDNYLFYMGFGWSHLVLDYNWGYASEPNNGNCVIMFGFPAKTGTNINVKNNLLYKSRYALVGGKPLVVDNKTIPQQYRINFSGNTYVQNIGGFLLEWGLPKNGNDTKKYLFGINAEKTVKDVLGDKTSVVLK